MIRNDPKDFADAVLAVLEDGTLRRRLGERGRATVERSYSWEVIGRAMVDTYLHIAGSHSTRHQGTANTRRVSGNVSVPV